MDDIVTKKSIYSDNIRSEESVLKKNSFPRILILIFGRFKRIKNQGKTGRDKMVEVYSRV